MLISNNSAVLTILGIGDASYSVITRTAASLLFLYSHFHGFQWSAHYSVQQYEDSTNRARMAACAYPSFL